MLPKILKDSFVSNNVAFNTVEAIKQKSDKTK